MGTVEQPTAAVRIELSNDDGSIVPPPVEPGGSGAKGAKMIGVIVSGLVVVAAMIWLTRPDDGQTAVGTPITVPTTVPTGSDSSDGRVNSERDGLPPPTTTSEPDPARTEYESVELETFFFSMVEAELGWIAFGIDAQTNVGALYRSTDGLNWNALPDDTLPAGDPIGLDRIDDRYVIAVDEERTWSQGDFSFGFGEDEQYPDHRISVWTSTDAVNWTPSDLPTLEGTGYPYFVTFTQDSYTVPMLVSPDDPHRFLTQLLGPFVDAEVAARVCSSERTFESEVRTIELRDCAGEVVAEVNENDFPDDFEDVWRPYCVEIARSWSGQGFSSMLVRRDGPPIRAELRDWGSMFGRAASTGYLSMPQGLEETLPSECGGSDVGTAVPETTLLFWTPDEGERDVLPAGLERSELVPQFGTGVVRGEDGRYYVALSGSVWAGVPPFTEWEEVLASPIDGSSTTRSNGETFLSLSGDGSHALLAVPGALFVAPLDGEWTQVPFEESDGFFTQIGVATDDYVVVGVQGPSGGRLIKVPLA